MIKGEQVFSHSYLYGFSRPPLHLPRKKSHMTEWRCVRRSRQLRNRAVVTSRNCKKMVCNWSKSRLLVFSTFLIVSPNEDSNTVGLILGEVVDQFAADLGPQDRRDPPYFWHLYVK